jgi:LPPG:FO 2-phospho-L-lactate transferase
MKVVALAGGVGAARLLSGVVELVKPNDLTVVVNTGDDFDWNGLRVCPDIDTIIYTLARMNAPDPGWGIAGDTFGCLDRMAALGSDSSWFRIGDRDLATHIVRTSRLRDGASLTQVTAEIAGKNAVQCGILPMSDRPAPTLIATRKGVLPFQDWFVRLRCAPPVLEIRYSGGGSARPASGVVDAIRAAGLVIVCPSNPLLSIGPILALQGIRKALRECKGRIVGVSPLIGGKALKGPTASLMVQLGHEPSPSGVAAFYRDFLDVLFIDETDAELAGTVAGLGPKAIAAPTLLDNRKNRRQLAKRILELAK